MTLQRQLSTVYHLYLTQQDSYFCRVLCVCVKKGVYSISLQLTCTHVEKDSVTTKKKVLLSKVSLCCKIFYKTWKHAFEKRNTYRERSFPIKISPIATLLSLGKYMSLIHFNIHIGDWHILHFSFQL